MNYLSTMVSFARSACVLAAITAVAPCVRGQVMENLGTIPGMETAPQGSYAEGVSADGRVVFGTAAGRAVRWVESGAMEELGGPQGGITPMQISADGSVIAGIGADASGAQQWFRWSETGGYQQLGSAGAVTRVVAMSADGSVLAGWGGGFDSNNPVRAFRWTAETGLVSLGLPAVPAPGGTLTDVVVDCMTDDGSVLVGHFNVNPTCADCGGTFLFKWTSQSGFVVLTGSTGAQVYGMSSDGVVLAGAVSVGGHIRLFRWTASTGMQVYIPSGELAAAHVGRFALSADGSAAAGQLGILQGATWTYRTFYWSAATGFLDLITPDPGYGDICFISADGQTVGLTATTAGVRRAYRWTLSGGFEDLAAHIPESASLYPVVFGMSRDGRVLVGDAQFRESGTSSWPRAFRYRADPFTVLLSGSASSIAPGDTFIVRAMCTAPAADMGGAQLTLHFDATRLRLDAVDPVAPAGLNLEISEQIDNTAGTLRYALGLSDPTVPLWGEADLCDLTFTVLPGADMCGAAGLVGFGNVGPFTTRFTEAATAAAVVPVLLDLAPVNLDATAPALAGVPADISVATDAGSTFGALVSLPTATATDDCDGPVSVSVSGVPSGGIFPIGTTTVTWTATDAAGNTATSSRTVTVEPYQLLDAVVSFSNPQLGASRHALRIGAGAAVEVVDTLIPEWSGTTPTSATVTVHVPVASSYPCVSVKSVGATVAGGAVRASHTLTDTASASVSGSRYRAEFVLLSGDSNDDDMVEILDYGNWLVDRSTPADTVRAPEARSNYNGDGLVIQGDVGLVVAYFFRLGESCTPGADAPRTPRDRIHVKELRRMGRGDLAAADLNHDGWVDTRDMRMALQGGGAPQGADIPHEAGGVAW